MDTQTPLTPAPTPTRRVLAIGLGLGLLIAVLTISFAWPSTNLAPNGIPIAVVGPPQAVAHVNDQLEAAEPDGFDVIQAATSEEATQLIEERGIYAALAIGADSVDLYTATAASPAVARLISGVADRIAAGMSEDLGQPHSVQVDTVDVVPLTTDDPAGAGLAAAAFPMAAGGLVIAALITMNVRGSRRQALTAVIAPIAAATGIAAILHFALGSLDGHYWITVGAISLTLLAAAWFVLGLAKLLGQVGIVLGAVTIMLVGNPLSGMTSAAELLPAPWGDVGQLMIPGAGATLLRSVSFFEGNGAPAPVLVLAAWLTVGVTLFVAASVRARARAAASVTNPELVHATPASAPRDEEQLTR